MCVCSIGTADTIYVNSVSQTTVTSWPSGQGVRLVCGKPGIQILLSRTCDKKGFLRTALSYAWRVGVGDGDGWPSVSVL